MCSLHYDVLFFFHIDMIRIRMMKMPKLMITVFHQVQPHRQPSLLNQMNLPNRRIKNHQNECCRSMTPRLSISMVRERERKRERERLCIHLANCPWSGFAFYEVITFLHIDKCGVLCFSFTVPLVLVFSSISQRPTVTLFELEPGIVFFEKFSIIHAWLWILTLAIEQIYLFSK